LEKEHYVKGELMEKLLPSCSLLMSEQMGTFMEDTKNKLLNK
jgi:hypothetical protein